MFTLVSPLKTLFALIVVLALISFVCTDVAYAVEIKPEVKGTYFEPTPDPKPPKEANPIKNIVKNHKIL